MKTKRIKNFITPLHLICGNDDIRYTMQYVYFENGFAYATDAHRMIKSALVLHDFIDGEVEHMNGKFLHKSAFAEIFKYHHVTATSTGFSCVKDEIKADFKYSVCDGAFPNCETILKGLIEGKSKEIDLVGINANYLAVIQKNLIDAYHCKLVFTGKNKPILVLANSDTLDSHNQIGLLAPCQTL